MIRPSLDDIDYIVDAIVVFKSTLMHDDSKPLITEKQFPGMISQLLRVGKYT